MCMVVKNLIFESCKIYYYKKKERLAGLFLDQAISAKYDGVITQHND